MIISFFLFNREHHSYHSYPERVNTGINSYLYRSLLDDVLIVPKHSIVQQVNEHYLPKLFHHTTAVGDAEAKKDSAARNLYFNDVRVTW